MLSITMLLSCHKLDSKCSRVLRQLKPQTEPAPANVFYSVQPASSSSNITTVSNTTAAKNESIAFFSQQTKENLEITASVIYCLNAFVTGKVDPPNFSIDDLDQMHPDDVEEMDIIWQMSMETFRAKHFIRRT
ncbi:hypothetical protein Hanom_Chr02g00141111 [Helianthus anomalus]